MIYKMPVQKPKEKENDFESEFDLEKIKTSAKLDIKPKIEFLDGIENAKDVIIKGTYYPLDLPADKQINKQTVKAINMMYEGIEHYFIAESESFRYQLEVIRFKKGLKSNKELDGLRLRIWTSEQFINTPNFKGKAKVYNLKPL